MVGVSPGQKVKVKHKGKTYVGTVMPRPELSKTSFLTLKLASGYDVGIPQSELESVEVLKEQKHPQAKSPPPLTHDRSKPTVSILSTGGTIASKVDYHTGGVNASFTAQDLLESMPEIGDLANIMTESVLNVMSEDMNPKLWITVAEAVAKALNGGSDGVVVTHGTDTMHYSTAALSFMLRNLGKPVVFTGAQRSTDRGSADSFLNLISSVAFAKSDAAGVYLVMHGSMADSFCFAHIGTKVRKMHTTRRDAFQSINTAPAAKISSVGNVELMRDLPRRSDSKVTVDSGLEENVALLKVYPGVDPGIVDYYLGRGVKGVVIEGTALGHVPTRIAETSLIPGIEKLVRSGVLVAMTTQCLFGRVNPYVYSNLREVSSRGVVYLEDMLPETAYVKMMWALGRSRGVEEARKLMLENVAGEMTERTEPVDKIVDI